MRDITYPPIVLTAYGFFRAFNIRFTLTGGEHVPRIGGAVLASNHVSYFDFIFCGYAARPSKRLVRFMAKKSTFDHAISGPLMRSMHHIPVDRAAGAASLDHAIDWLRQGEIVGVFPEATISQSFEVKDFKSGAVRMAAEAGVPIIPMITFGGQRMWTKGHKREMTRGTLVALTVGAPITVTEQDDPVEATAHVRSVMQDLYEQTIEQYEPKPEPGAWWWPARYGGSAPTLDEMREKEREDRAQREGSD
ncbi:MAG: 1-acyl-sn-glycerol-3-phosphate acyltransferase [Micrococcales bacterium]|nr:1-acyl-sn-glycerol-3-phosphate acyltransferase [Micrococcales bacterium]